MLIRQISDGAQGAQPDMLTMAASVIFDVPFSEVTPEMRGRAKTILYVSIYGAGPRTLERMMEKWTSPTIRKHLGERGFIQDGDSIRDFDKDVSYSSFVRGEDELTLVEFGNNAEPIVTQEGKQVLVSDIGYRNEQLQHKPLLGD